MDLKLQLYFLVMAIGKYGQCQEVVLHQLTTVNVSVGDSFTLWCNATGTLSAPYGYQITWKKTNDNITMDSWCTGAALQNEILQGRKCNRSEVTFFNVSDIYAIGLSMSASTEDRGRYRCSFAVFASTTYISLEETKVYVKENIQTTTAPPETTLGSTETSVFSGRPSTTPSSTRSLQTTTEGPGSKETTTPSTADLSKETIIAIGAGGGGGVLLVTIIVVVVCVKKKGKGNSTSDIDERKSTYRKSNPFEYNTENADNKRKSNPLEKNVENLHYADLTLHENSKSSSSKGTGSAKSKTLTVNPSDERVEYAAVMAS